MDFFRNGNVSTGDIRTTHVVGHQENFFYVETWRHNAHRQRVVSHPEPPMPSRLHRDNNANRGVTTALGVDPRHVVNVQEPLHDGQLHHNARRQRVGSRPDPPAPSGRHRNNANLDVPTPSDIGTRHLTANHGNRQPRQQQNPRRQRSLSQSDVPVPPRRHDNTDTNRPVSSVRLFDARGNKYNEVGGRVYDYFHDAPHRRELSRRDASPPTYHHENATTARNGANFDEQQTTRLSNNQRHSQSVVSTISIETSSSATLDSSSSATLDSYTATHDPPPYARTFPRMTSTTTLTSSSSGDMTYCSDKKSQPRGSVMQPWPRPETPSPFVSRYIVFHLDRETTAEQLREVGDNALIPIVKSMSDDNYIGYISEGDMDDPQVYRLFLLCHDLPGALVERGLTPDMSIAVEPNKQRPYEREPLRPEKELPSRWGDCYHFAHDHLLVRIPHIPSGTGYYAISGPETRRHLDTIRKDLKRRVVKQNNYWVERSASSPDEIPLFAPRNDSDVSLMEMQSEAIMTIQISHDIERMTKVPDPYEFMQQQWYLAQTKKVLMMNRKAELESAASAP